MSCSASGCGCVTHAPTTPRPAARSNGSTRPSSGSSPPGAGSLDELQAQLDDFCELYNTLRPHRALGRRTPATAFQARPKAVPTGLAETVPSHYRVRHDRIDPSGVITLRHNSRLHHIGLGRRHGTRVLVLIRELHIRVLTEDSELLRELTLDPSRDYQGQPKP